MAKRYDYMDWLRVLAIFVVVGVHVVSKIINTGSTNEWEWQYANAVDSAIRWCVPVFFMLSGALLLTVKRDEPVGSFLKKRLTKVFIPLVFWSGVYIAYKVFEQGESFTAWQMVELFIIDDVYYHLWFLYTIIALYIMTPFLRILVDYMKQKTFIYFLVFWFIYSGILPFITKFLEIEPAFTAGLFQPYIGYFLLGAYLVLYPLPKKSLPLLACLAIAGYIATFWGTHYLTEKHGELDEFFYEHFRPNNLAITLFVFVLFQQLAPRIKPNKWITRISTATLGIYVIHPLVQFYLDKFLGINELLINAAIGVPLVWVLIFAISFGIILILQKIPGAKYILP